MGAAGPGYLLLWNPRVAPAQVCWWAQAQARLAAPCGCASNAVPLEILGQQLPRVQDENRGWTAEMASL